MYGSFFFFLDKKVPPLQLRPKIWELSPETRLKDIFTDFRSMSKFLYYTDFWNVTFNKIYVYI